MFASVCDLAVPCPHTSVDGPAKVVVANSISGGEINSTYISAVIFC